MSVLWRPSHCEGALKAGQSVETFAGAFKREAKKGEPFPGWRHPCECYVFHMSDSQFVAAHCTGGSNGWYTGRGAAGLMVAKDLLPAIASK